jgi:hypothetical protein
MLLIAVGIGVYLNQVGLPFFARGWLASQFQSRGLDVSFERLRIRLGRGIVAEKIQLRRINAPAPETISAAELQLRLDWGRVLRLHPEIVAVLLRNGRFEISFPASNAPPASFAIEKIGAQMRFDSAEEWRLERFDAVLLGSHLRAAGSITNVFALRGRKSSQEGSWEAWRRVLLDTTRAVQRCSFDAAPDINLTFSLDLKRPDRSQVRFDFAAAGAKTPWGEFGNLNIKAGLNDPPAAQGAFSTSLQIDASRARSRWVRLESLTANAQIEHDADNSIPRRIRWDARASSARGQGWQCLNFTGSGVTTSARAVPSPSAPFLLPYFTNANWTLAPRDIPAEFVSSMQWSASGLTATNFRCMRAAATAEIIHGANTWNQAQAQIDAVAIKYKTYQAGDVKMALRASPNPLGSASNPNLGWWNWASPLRFHATAIATNMEAPPLRLELASATLDYATNRLVVERFIAALFGGSASVAGSVDALTRQAEISAQSHFDAHQLEPLLTENGRHWMKQFGWTPAQPPALDGKASARLPAWTNRGPDWRGEVLPTLAIQAGVTATNFNFRGIAGDRVRGHIGLSNNVWNLPDLFAERSDGVLHLAYTEDMSSQDYHFHLRSDMDPRVAAPLVEPAKAREQLTNLFLTLPPLLEGDVWGRWHEVERSGFQIRAAATNCGWKGEHLDRVDAIASYTNGVLEITRAVAVDGEQDGSIGRLAFNFNTRMLEMSNVVSRFDPERITRQIGPKTYAMLRPYRFAAPPRVVINGRLDTGSGDNNDMFFDVAAPGRFDWLRIHATAPSSLVHYQGRTVTLSNFTAGFYGGDIKGDAVILVDPSSPSAPTGARVEGRATEIDLHDLMTELGSPTNRIEGRLTVSAKLQTKDVQIPVEWKGNGKASLHDGFLWDVPLLGVFSTLFNAVSPGWGQARFTGGDATFRMQGGRIHSSDLELKSASMKLDYSGWVDTRGQIDATMQAQMFNRVPLLGPLAGFALKPFEKVLEYKLSGNIGAPKAEPAYIPSFLLIPLHPFQTLRDLLPSEKHTNAPPALSPTNSVNPNN